MSEPQLNSSIREHDANVVIRQGRFDKMSVFGGDGTNGSPATGWPRYNRLAAQPAAYVGPGQVS